PEAFFLKGKVANREHLIDNQDFRVEVSGDSERKPHRHPGRIPFHRHINEGAAFGERDDLIELPDDLAPPHAENRAGKEYVFSAGQIVMKTGADFEQRAHAAPDLRITFRWF